ncbi:MAG TPA: hypothetical protein DG753_08655 [Clostridium sp.]|nr:hypothetical protein [Clostridium sp.]
MKSNKLKIIAGIIIVFGLPILFLFGKTIFYQGIIIKSWNNYYDEGNIVLFYESLNNQKNSKLNEKYQINDFVNSEQSEFDKVLKCTNIVKGLIEKDDVPETGLRSAFDILEKKTDSKKVNFKDAAIIARDIINCTGVKTRIGVFRKGGAQYENNCEYYVIEYWSTELNKWVMVDFLDQGYFLDGDNKLSAIEVLKCNLRRTPYLGNTSQQDYKNNINKYLDSYSVNIENSNANMRSNCIVTYVKNDEALEIKFKNKYPAPTIFTKQTQLFEKSPFNDLLKDDSKEYLLITVSKLIEENKDKSDSDTLKTETNSIGDKKEKIIGDKIMISAFKNDKVLKSFYLSINGSEFEKIENYKERVLEKGTTKIDLSTDGSTVVSSVTIDKK